MQHKIIMLSVAAVVPSSVTLGELKDYAVDALSIWGGQRHPDDHLFNSLDIRAITAVRITSIKGSTNGQT